MQNFDYYNPVHIVFGRDTISRISKLIDEKYSKILLVYGGGSIKNNGVYETIINSLANRRVIEFSGVEANPKYETLMKAVSLCREEKIDFIIAAGGGSVIDGVKFIAAAAKFEGNDPWDILVARAPVKSAIPFGSVLTLPATGSEMNNGSVISRLSTKEKFPFMSDKVFPVFSILDPETTKSLPEKQLANGIIDAFVHVCEQYLTKDIDAPLQYYQSEAVLKTLIDVAPRVLGCDWDYNARASFMWAATAALNKNIGCGVLQDWSTHMIGHELTALFGLDHAVTLAIILPGVLSAEKENKRSMLLRYAKNVWSLAGKDDEIIALAIEKTETFFNMLGTATRLSDYNISHEEVLEIPKRFENRRMKLGENGDINFEKIAKILESRL